MPKAKPKQKQIDTKPKSIKFPENDEDEIEQKDIENGNDTHENDDQDFADEQPALNDEDDDDDAPEEVTFTSSKQFSTQQRQEEKQARRQANEAAKKHRATSTGTGIKANKKLQDIESQIQQAKEVLEQLDHIQLPDAEEQNDVEDEMDMDDEETEYFTGASTKGRSNSKQIGNLDVVALYGEQLPAPEKTRKKQHKTAAELESMLHEHFYGTRMKRMKAVRYAAKGNYRAPEIFATDAAQQL